VLHCRDNCLCAFPTSCGAQSPTFILVQLPLSFMASFLTINVDNFPSSADGGLHISFVLEVICKSPQSNTKVKVKRLILDSTTKQWRCPLPW